MKSFKEIREKKTDDAKTTKVQGVEVKIAKTPSGYVTHIDGDKFDTFRSESQAMKAATAMIKQLKARK